MTDRASFARAIRSLTELPSTMPADTVLVLVGVALICLPVLLAVFGSDAEISWAFLCITCAVQQSPSGTLFVLNRVAQWNFQWSCLPILRRYAANKSDLSEQRAITEEEGREASEAHNCAHYAETSAKTSDGIEGKFPISCSRVIGWTLRVNVATTCKCCTHMHRHAALLLAAASSLVHVTHTETSLVQLSCRSWQHSELFQHVHCERRDLWCCRRS